MYVSGSLITLPRESYEPYRVPLPWHCRAPLGMKSKTTVYAALVASSSYGGRLESSSDRAIRRPPDLVVSVLAPDDWNTFRVIRSRGTDGPGLLNSLLSSISQLNTSEPDPHVNVIVGESFTIPSGKVGGVAERLHETTLFVELRRGKASDQALTEMVSAINKSSTVEAIKGAGPKSSEGGAQIQVEVDQYEHPAGWVVKQLGTGFLADGYLHLNTNWRARAREWDPELSDSFDFERACVYASTLTRAITFTFPRKGAQLLITKHSDKPNTAVKLTTALADAHQSILAGLLAKVDEKTGSLELVAEPIDPKRPLQRETFAKLLAGADYLAIEIETARNYQDTLWPPLPRKELFRQLGRDLFGEPCAAHLERLFSNIPTRRRRRVPEGTEAPAVQCFVSCAASRPIQREGRDAVLSLLKTSGIDPCGDVATNFRRSPITAGERLVQMIASNFAIFLLWREADDYFESATLAESIIYSKMREGSGSLLVQTDDSTQLNRIRALVGETSLFQIEAFSWNDLHDAAWRGYIAELQRNPSAECPWEVMESKTLASRVLDWLHRNQLRQDGAA